MWKFICTASFHCRVSAVIVENLLQHLPLPNISATRLNCIPPFPLSLSFFREQEIVSITTTAINRDHLCLSLFNVGHTSVSKGSKGYLILVLSGLYEIQSGKTKYFLLLVRAQTHMMATSASPPPPHPLLNSLVRRACMYGTIPHLCLTSPPIN